MIHTFDYDTFMKPEVRGSKGMRDKGYNREWFGNQSFEQIVHNAIHGDESLVPEAEKLIAQLDADIELEHPEWISSVYGAYPIVPEFLAGSPTPMRHRTRVPSDSEPIGIWIDLNSSCGLSYELMKKRGIVVLALLLKLQQVRAIDLHCCAAMVSMNTFIDVVMPTKPLQLGVVTHVLTCVGFPRHVMYGAAVHLSKNPNWASCRVIRDDREFRQVMNIPDNDVTIVGSHLFDVKELANSLAWIQGMVNKYVHREE